MFRPNTTCRLFRAGGKTTVFGQTQPGKGVIEPCSIVSINPKESRTPVSTRVSATRAGAQELTADAVVLFRANTLARYDDVFSFAGARYKIIGMTPQYSPQGLLDHFEAHAVIYSQTSKETP